MQKGEKKKVHSLGRPFEDETYNGAKSWTQILIQEY